MEAKNTQHAYDLVINGSLKTFEFRVNSWKWLKIMIQFKKKISFIFKQFE